MPVRRTFVAVLGALTLAACASGGSSPPVAGPAAEALFTSLTGAWVLDMDETQATRGSLPSAVGSDELQVVPADAASHVSQQIRDTEDRAMFNEVAGALHWPPRTLALHVDPTQVVFMPTPGDGVTLLMDGTPVTDTVKDLRVRTRVSWQEEMLGLERKVDSGLEAREVFEVVGDRLTITRTLHAFDVTSDPFLWVYDRKEGGFQSPETRKAEGSWGNGDGNSTPKQINRAKARETLVREYLASGLARQGVTGRTVVKFHVDIRGRVQDVEVAEGSGNAMLDQLALRVARTYEFTPIVFKGEATPGAVRLRLSFSLGGR